MEPWNQQDEDLVLVLLIHGVLPKISWVLHNFFALIVMTHIENYNQTFDFPPCLDCEKLEFLTVAFSFVFDN
jgi:hypothetical protein